MRRRVSILAFVVLVSACNQAIDTTTTAGQREGTTGTDNVLATAIRYVLDETDLESKDLVYVAGPSTELWDQWCDFDTGEPGEEPLDAVPAACDVLDSTTFDLPATYEDDAAAEISEALSPAAVEFVDDPNSVIGTLDEGMMIAPIENDAGLLSFGVMIEADGKFYLPVDAHGEGWLFELTTTSTGENTWNIRPLAAYAA